MNRHHADKFAEARRMRIGHLTMANFGFLMFFVFGVFAKNSEDLFAALNSGTSVGGDTGWLWSRMDAFEAVDVLFVDEAAQMSLANVLAVSHAAKTVVLIGDPQQLDQPMQGSHPEGTDLSALDHILSGQHTIPQRIKACFWKKLGGCIL